MSDLDNIYPAISDLRKAAQKRMPKFAFEFLDSATGSELGAVRARKKLDEVLFMPDVLKGALKPNLQTTFLGDNYDAPFGIAPVGFSGVVWPRAEKILAKHASGNNIPYCLPTIGTEIPENIAPLVGKNGWFQLYAASDPVIEKDMLDRAKRNGFDTLVVTLDVPGDSRRERQRRALLSLPFKFTPWVIWQLLTHPRWSLAFAAAGIPRMQFLESYRKHLKVADGKFVHLGRQLRGYPDPAHLKRIRKQWNGKLIVKGILDPARAKELVNLGADAIWVSNHGGRQFEAAPAAITQLPLIKEAVPNCPLIFDSGVAGGLDIMRGLALGADFVMLGRAWHYALGALGAKGPAQCHHILREDMIANMVQLGVEELHQIKDRLHIK